MDREVEEMEEELERELKRISLSYCEEDEEEWTEPPEEASAAFSDELPDSILHCLQYAKKRAENAEKLILEDLEDLDTLIGNSYEVVPHQASDLLAELASEYNEDPEALKTRILAEIEKEDNTDLQLSFSSDPCVINFPQDNDFAISEFPESNTLDRGDMTVNFDYLKVEEKCRKELQIWEERHKQFEGEMLIKLKAEKELQEKKKHEEEEKRRLWLEEFEKEKKRLEMSQKEQEAKMKAEEENEKAAFAEELKHHEDLINRLQEIIESEKKSFEEQKEKERQIVEKVQCKAATIIQARFRAFLSYRKYAPKLKELKAENERRKELQLKMDKEKKAAEAKIKQRLEEKKRKEEEKKRKEEEERKRFEEVKQQESLKIELRRLEYEKKKEAERQRLEKEKQVKLEELKQSEERKQKDDKVARKHLEENESHMVVNHSTLETTTEQESGQHHNVCKRDQMLGKKLVKKVWEGKNEKRKQIGNECFESQETGIMNLWIEKQLIPTEHNSEQHKKTSLMEGSSVKEPVLEVILPSHKIKTDSKAEEPVAGDSKLNISSDETIPQIKETEQSQHVGTVEPSDEVANMCQSFRSEEVKDHIEEKRLTWMKNCIPWSKVLSENQRKKVMKKSKPRKSSAANKLPPLNPEVILKTGPWHVLKQVTTVTLEDLPGCSLSTLSECTKLQSLTLRRCGLTALEGLDKCSDLKYIDVQENSIQILNCEALENLCTILLSSNRLTSIHGLDGCPNLKNLELSYNKITRIGGLEGLRRLQRLVIDHNQLISTKGLEATPTVMYLDFSFNHLTELEGIHKCGLLQILKLQGNNLSKPPDLENQVLLRELYLDDNSVTALEVISSCWLPLLQNLSLSQNSLTHLAPLSAFLSLEKLDISNNCLSELQNVLRWIDGCENLRELSLNGNPLLQDSDWKCSLMKILPGLKILNDEALPSEKIAREENCSLVPKGSFLAFCQAQIQEVNLLNKRHDDELGVACSSLEVSQIQCRYFDEIMKLSNEHRYSHEYGIVNVNESLESEAQRDRSQETSIGSPHNHASFTCKEGNKLQTPEARSSDKPVESILKSSINSHQRNGKEENTACSSVPVKEDKDLNLACGEKNTIELARKSTLELKHLHSQRSIENSAATVIQRYWRGYAVRRDISFYITLHEAAVVIQTAWRKFHCRKSNKSAWKKEKLLDLATYHHRCEAATRIQACWKGFYLRKKLSAALAAIVVDELDEDFEEVNLDDFTYDEAALEKEWLAFDSSTSSPKTVLISNQLYRPKNPVLTTANMPPILPLHPHQAWQCDEVSNGRTKFTPEKKEYDSSAESKKLTIRYDLRTSHENIFKSGKEGIISEEWGFKDVTTAQLMLRRAQKMKSKQARNRKLLDPAVRLALFRNNENKHASVKPPRKIQPARVEYFRGREEEFASTDKVPSEKIERSRELTYQWLHTQCGDHETANSRIMKCNRFLPELDPEILNGGRVQLVASLVGREPMDVDLVSVTSASALTQSSERPSQAHRHSAGSSSGDTPVPLKSNGGPVRKERISFRDNPVQLSGGWGGGKKRTKTLK
ncbi:leucine-rich repeat and IQ domain-containing protein 1 isoform X2 [Pleurodeles waltl]|uniref:leucine-rich repeat and IQ domain-containing protein 1 isoform X2 n=1 Tax=Pleurodeles waltl TaxID=8319 RepID=UPI0037094378